MQQSLFAQIFKNGTTGVLVMAALFAGDTLAQGNLCGKTSTFDPALSCLMVLDSMRAAKSALDYNFNPMGGSDQKTCQLVFSSPTEELQRYCLVEKNQIKCQKNSSKPRAESSTKWGTLIQELKIHGRIQEITDGKNTELLNFFKTYTSDFADGIIAQLSKIPEPGRRCNTLKWTSEKIEKICSPVMPSAPSLVTQLNEMHDSLIKRGECTGASRSSTPSNDSGKSSGGK